MPAAVEPRDLAAIEKAVNEASGRASTLWLSFLTLATYLAISVGSVTHRMLFLAEAIRLPILNVDLPLVAFFVVAPGFVVLFHFYLLMQLVILARKVGTYDATLRQEVRVAADRAVLRRRLDGFVIVQLLAGTERERKGFTAALLRVIAWITLILVPLALLVMTQLVFLPYQHPVVTWLHRACIALDLLLVWCMWPAVRSLDGEIGLRRIGRSSVRTAALAVPCALVILFTAFLATHPGEGHDRNRVATGLDALVAGVLGEDAPTLSERLFDGPINPVSGQRLSLLSRTLVLPDADFIDDEKLGKIVEREKANLGTEGLSNERTIALRLRSLRGAVLDRADLRRADLTSAMLDGASLGGTRLDHATLNRASLVGADLDGARLRGADLREAVLTRATLANAELQGSQLGNVEATNADLAGANLDGASIRRANLACVNLRGASLRGATLVQSRLDAAVLDRAELQAATIIGFVGVGSASLRGASLREAQLQGAEFTLDGPLDLTGAFLWQARIARRVTRGDVVVTTDARLEPQFGRARPVGFQRSETLSITADAVLGWERQASEYVREPRRRDGLRAAFTRLHAALPSPKPTPLGTNATPASASEPQAGSGAPSSAPQALPTQRVLEALVANAQHRGAEYGQALADLLIGLACPRPDAGDPASRRPIVCLRRLPDLGDERRRVATHILDERLCPAAHPLDPETAKDLREHVAASPEDSVDLEVLAP